MSRWRESVRRDLLPSLRAVRAAASPRNLPAITDCLRLRGLARAVLFGAPAAIVEARLSAAERCTAQSWRSFLQTDRCATQLYARLQERNYLEHVDADCRAVLGEIRRDELQRILAARAQIADVSRVAAEIRCPAVLLKGGVAVADGQLLDLVDVDVLVPEAADSFARELERRGYSAGPARDPDAPHLPPHSLPGLLHVEVHRRLEGFDGELIAASLARAQPLSSTPGLLRLAAPDQLWHILLHIGVQHLDRRATLRDHLLMRAAAAACAPAELDQVRDRIRAHPAAGALGQTLAAALGDGADPDPLAGFAAARYANPVLLFTLEPMPPDWLWVPLTVLTLAFALKPRDYFRSWRGLLRPAPVRRRRLPGAADGGAGRALLILLRALRLAALTPVATLLAWKSARAQHALIDTSPREDRS